MLTCLRGHQCHGSRKKANFQTSHSRYTWSGKFDRPSKQIRNRARRRRRRQHQSYNQSAGSKCSTWSGKTFKLPTPGTQGMSSTRIARSVTVKADKKSCDDNKSSTRASHDRSPSKQIRSRTVVVNKNLEWEGQPKQFSSSQLLPPFTRSKIPGVGRAANSFQTPVGRDL